MSTFREIVYMCSDQLKLSSDDTFFTNDHILYLLKKYRGLFLSQKYKDVRKEIPESNYQTICLDLIQVPAISGEPCEGEAFLRTRNKIPTLMSVGATKVYPVDYYVGDITLVTRERMRYVGHNKYLQNIIYASLGPDGYLYFKSSNPQYLYLEKVKMLGIFEDPKEAINLQCSGEEETKSCDILDYTFPIEEALVPPIVELILKELINAEYRPEDKQNNADDELSNVTVK